MSDYVWFNSICYQPPPPTGHTPGDLPFFFFTGRSISHPRHKETTLHSRDSPLVTHFTHTQKRNNTAFCVQNQDNNIYFCAKPYHKNARNTRCRHRSITDPVESLSRPRRVFGEKSHWVGQFPTGSAYFRRGFCIKKIYSIKKWSVVKNEGFSAL